MDPMHVRCDDEAPKETVYVFRQEKIAVLEFGRGRQQGFEGDQPHDRYAEEDDRGTLEQRGNQHFT